MKHSLIILIFFASSGLAACGKSSRSDQTDPSLSHPEWSLTVGEPNEICPGAFDRSVKDWPNEADVRLLGNAISELPKHVKQAACRVAKFRIESEDFFATGIMSPGIDSQHSEVGFHPVLFRLRPTLSQLLTWRDRQIVETNQRSRYDADNAPLIVSVSLDDFAAALSYVLAHELGHVANFQPEWSDFIKQTCNPDCKANSWRGGKSDRFKESGKFCFYNMCDRRLSSAALPKAYEELASSDFISLYAASNPMEDVAEMYAASVLFDTWKWTWKTSAGDQTFNSAEHWTGPKMAAKRDLISKFAVIDLPPPRE